MSNNGGMRLAVAKGRFSTDQLRRKVVCDPIQYPDQIGIKTIDMMMKYLAGEDIDQEMDNGQILIPSKLYYKADADSDPALQ